MFQMGLKAFQRVSMHFRSFKGSFNGSSRGFQGAFKGVSMHFRGFQGVSNSIHFKESLEVVAGSFRDVS